METKKPIVLFIGPTAAGKTRFAIEVAQLMGQVEIISCDSRLFYRGMDIGTAKPARAEMRGVVHHMIDIVDPDEVLSLGIFQKQTREIISQIHQRGNKPFLVGGTGQYIRAVTEGWDLPSVEPNLHLRGFLVEAEQSKGLSELSRWLKMLDPVAYAQVDLRNPRRVHRALEVILTTGRLFSSQRSRTESAYRIIQIGLTMPREILFQRIDDRIEQMVRAGFEDEVQRLLDSGIDPSMPSLSAIGYSEMAAKIRGQMTLDEAIVLMKRRTHAYVRRQANWFKADDPSIHWFDSRTSSAEQIRAVIENKLGMTSG